MADMINVAREELERLHERTRKLALENSFLQFVNNLMNTLSTVPGLENTVDAIVKLILKNIGGSNVALYYWVGSSLHYADAHGRKRIVEVVEDDLVRKAFEGMELVEDVRDFADTEKMRPEFTKASYWALPLVVGEKTIGVLKMEGMLMAKAQVRTQLQPFFNYTALVLKNELENYSKLMNAYNQLGKANEDLRREADERFHQQQFLEAVLEHTEAGIVACDAKGVLTLFNRKSRELHGLPQRPIPADEWAETYDLYLADGKTPMRKENVPLFRALQGEHVMNDEMMIIPRGGEPKALIASGQLIKDREGRIVGAVVAMHDITERKKAEEDLRKAKEELEVRVAERTAELQTANEELEFELAERARAETALRESEAFLNTLLNAIPIPVFYKDRDGRYLGFNAAFEAFFDATREQLIGKTAFDLYPLELAKMYHTKDNELYGRGGVQEYESQITNVHGIMHDVIINKAVFPDNQGAISGLIGTILDITERKQMQRELAVHEREYRTLIENIPELVVRYDKNLHRTYVNPAWEKASGLTAAEVINVPADYTPKVPRPTSAEYFEKIQRVLATGAPQVCEFTWVNARGEELFLEYTIVPEYDRDGNVAAALAAGHDSTERKQAEIIMQARLRLLEFASSHSLDDFLTATLDEIEALTGSTIGFCHFVEDDQEFLTLQNWSTRTKAEFCKAEGKGMHYPISKAGVWVDCVYERKPVIHNDYASLPHLKGMPQGHAEVIRELVVPVIRSNRIKAILGVGNKPTDYTEKDVEATSLLADLAWEIAERKRTEEKMLRSDQRLRLHSEHSPLGFLEWDENFHAVEWNAACEKIFGFTREEAIGRHAKDLILPEEVHGLIDRVFQSLMNQTGGQHSINQNVTKDGRIIICEWFNTTLIDKEGKAVGVASVCRDITEQKRTEEKLKEYREHLEDLVEQRTDELVVAKERAEAANLAKSAFLANMSHELRTPLNIILGFTQLMERDPAATTAQRETLSMISRNGEDLLGLINDVLDMSRIEAGHSVLRAQSFDLHRTLLNIEEMMHSRATGKGLKFAVQTAPDVPRFIASDAAKLRQVLLNLVGNAIKFTSKGGVILRVMRGKEGGGGPKASDSAVSLHFEVEDTGIGITPERARSIFQPFVQIQNGQEAREGTGLGLAICRDFVQLMGGEIGAESKVGAGSIFWFNIQAEMAEAEDSAGMEQPVHRVAGLSAGQPRYRILVVDDMQESRLLLRKLLESVGFEVHEAGNGQEAVEQFEQWGPQLIWMDMRMPVMDGYEATRRIKASSRSEETKIICISASPFEEQRTHALSSGCDDFVRKPFREADIFEAIRKQLGVEYVYDVEKVPSSRETWGDRGQVHIAPEKLAALPADLLASLARAAEGLKVSDIQAILEQIRKLDQDIGDRLADLAKDFRYDILLTTILQASQRSEEGEGGHDPQQ